MTPTQEQTLATARFTCTGDACPDTCCKGWGMQLTQQNIDLYKREAPELMEAVTSGEAEFIMRRDEATDHCVKLDKGWCSIHRDYGDRFLGDACHFYPRITRAVGDVVFTTLGLSCPEAARLMLYTDDAFVTTGREAMRLPYVLKNYLPEGLAVNDALALHRLFLEQAGRGDSTAECNLMRSGVVARALETQPKEQWPGAAAFYFKMADGRIPAAEAAPADYFNLLNALQGLISASKASKRARLLEVVERMAEALGATLDWEHRAIAPGPDAPERVLKIIHAWRAVGALMQPVLKRYLQAQLSNSLFPFAGLGGTLSERITIIGVRFATVKLALMSEAVLGGKAPEEGDVVRIVQTLSRFMDHLAEPELSLAMYKETGWVKEARLRALVGDN